MLCGPSGYVCPTAGGYSRIVNYSADAGAGSQIITNLSESSGWRAALLGTVAAGALWLGIPRQAKAGPDACDVSVAGVATCQGNQSAGITSAGTVPPNFDPTTVTTLNVNELTTNIAPASGVDGVYFHRTGAGNDIVIDLDTTDGPGSSKAIIVNGAFADGIDAVSDAAITIMQSGDIDAEGGRDGIYARLGESGAALNITSNDEVVGGLRGIDARNYGLGALAVTANGDVTGLTTVGIYAWNHGGTDLTVTTGAGSRVTGGTYGIDATNFGSGDTTIIANGEVEAGKDGTGIFAMVVLGGGDLGITSHAVSGGQNGIFAINTGAGDTKITALGDVVATDLAGIFARSLAGPGEMAIVTESVSGGLRGIYARNAGALTITANGDVNATSEIGIFARNSGIGALTITTHGEVTAGTYGIFARGNGVNITTQDVHGGIYGIIADNYSGALTVTAHGDVVGTAKKGIDATGSGSALSIVSEAVAGGMDGISARNFGFGALSIVANGDVTGILNRGISARNYGTALSITTGLGASVTGGIHGIYALNRGSGALTVTTGGDVTGTSGDGIYALTLGAGSNIAIINSGDIHAGSTGINAKTSGNNSNIVLENEGDVYASYMGLRAATEGVGSDITLTSIGNIASTGGGDYSVGVFAYGSHAISVTSRGEVAAHTEAGSGFIRVVGINAISRSTAGDSGPVNVESSGDIAARVVGQEPSFLLQVTGLNAESRARDDSAAVTVASIGNITAIAPASSFGLATGINAVSRGGSDSGAVSVESRGDIAAISAQGDSLGIYAVSFTDIATAGDVTVNSTGNVTAIAERFAVGLSAESTSLYGAAGDVSITSRGDIKGTAGIVGISSGGVSNGDVAITILAGKIMGSTTGVEIVEGAANSLDNHGTIISPGTAILSDSGDETVNNFGTVTGNVSLGAGTNEFNNKAGALFNSGAIIDLGSGNLLTNHGTLAPGGIGVVLTTALTGDLAQPGSAFAVDIDGSVADKIQVSGNASMAGLVKPALLNLDGSTRWTIMTSGTGPIDNGVTVQDSPIVDYELFFPSLTEMVLTIAEVNFALEGLNRNETAIAENLNYVFKSGNFPKLEPLLTALANLPNVGTLANALDQLSPEIYLDQQIATLFSSANFTASLMTCPVRDGAAAYIKEGQCVWARLSGRDFEQDATFQTLGFDETSFEVAGGLQGALGPVWRIGFAGAYEHGSLDTDRTFATSEVDRAHAGAVLKYNPGALLLAAAVSGGWGWYDTERPIAFTGFSALPSSGNEIGYLNGRFRAEYLLSAGGWYAKPLVDFDATAISLEHVKETGAGGAGLNVRGNDQTVLSATPALELGAQFGGPAGTLVRPYIRGGATFFDDPEFVLLASFEGAPDGVGPFRIATRTDEVIGLFGAGFDVVGTDGASFRLYYEGRFSDLVEQHAGGIKASLPF